MKAKVVVPIVAIVVIAIAAGTMLMPMFSPPVNAREVVNSAVAALEEINTASTSLDMTISIEAQGQRVDVEMEMIMLVDYVDKEMYMNMTGHVRAPGMPIEMHVEMYALSNQTMYVALSMPGMGTQWTKSYIPDEEWDLMFTPISTNFGELAEASQLKYVGSETVNGIDCYIIEFKPTPEELAGYIQKMMGPQTTTTAVPFNLTQIIKEGLKEFSLKMWISKTDYMIRKQDIYMKLTAPIMGMTVNMDIRTTGTMKWNIPVEIKLPPEAGSAMETPFKF